MKWWLGCFFAFFLLFLRIFLFSFLKRISFIYFQREKERLHIWVWGRDRGRGRISSPLQAERQGDKRLHLTTLQSGPEPKSSCHHLLFHNWNTNLSKTQPMKDFMINGKINLLRIKNSSRTIKNKHLNYSFIFIYTTWTNDNNLLLCVFFTSITGHKSQAKVIVIWLK